MYIPGTTYLHILLHCTLYLIAHLTPYFISLFVSYFILTIFIYILSRVLFHSFYCFYVIFILVFILFFCTFHWADLSWLTFHYLLYPVWLCMWQIIKNLEPKDRVGYKKIDKTLKLSSSTVAKTIHRFNRTGSSQNRPRHGQPKKLRACTQRHIQRLCLGNRRMSAVSIAAEVEGVGVQPVSAQTIRRSLHKLVCMTVIPEGSPF